MIIEQTILADKLSKVINIAMNSPSNSEFIKEVTRILKNKGISPGETMLILDGKIVLSTITIPYLGVICDAVYSTISKISLLRLHCKDINIVDNFTGLEINAIKGYKKEKKAETKYIKFYNVIEISDNKWLTKVSNKDIKNCFDLNRLGYDTAQQRELFGDKIDIDYNQVDEIKELMLEGDYHINMLTFNTSYGAEVRYDPIEQTLDVPEIMYVTDGWTRCNATLRATNEDSTLEFYQPLLITSLLPEEAGDMTVQFNKQRKFRHGTTYKKSMAPAPTLVKQLMKSKSVLSGNIGYSEDGRKMFSFNQFVEIIENTYERDDLKNNFKRLEIMKQITDGFEILAYNGIIKQDEIYYMLQLAYFHVCIKEANDRNIDLMDLVKKNPYEKISEQIDERRIVKVIKLMKGMLSYE